MDVVVKQFDQSSRSHTQVRISYEERHSGDWGGYRPKVVVEYDERNSYLMAIDVTYNRREADKNLGYNYRELKDKIQHELDSAQVKYFLVAHRYNIHSPENSCKAALRVRTIVVSMLCSKPNLPPYERGAHQGEGGGGGCNCYANVLIVICQT